MIPPTPPPRQDDHPSVTIEGEQTAGGLTQADVNNLIAEGFSAPDIMLADAIAAGIGLDTRQVLAQRAEGKGWGEIIRDSGGPQLDSGGEVPIPRMIRAVAEQTGLSEDEVAALHSAGHSFNDITNAQVYASWYNLPVAAILHRKGPKGFDDLAFRLATNADPVLLADVVQISGRTEAEIRALIRQGHDLVDIRQAARLVEASKKALEAVLALHRGRNWKVVADELLHAANPTEQSNPSPDAGGN